MGCPSPRWHRGHQARRLYRYASASVVSTVVGVVALALFVGLAGVPAGWANVAATAIGTVPSFELNRRWVWSKRGQRSFTGEILPFAVLSFAGLALSTLTVKVAAVVAARAGWGHLLTTLAVEAGHIAGFGVLWVVQYLILDRVLFGSRARPVGAGG